MVTKKVIKEIYQKFNTPPDNINVLNLGYHMELLKEHHPMKIVGEEIIVENVEEYSPFKRMLIERLTGVFEFNKYVAFVMAEHILFFEKRGEGVSLHFLPIKKESWIKRFLGRFLKNKS